MSQASKQHLHSLGRTGSLCRVPAAHSHARQRATRPVLNGSSSAPVSLPSAFKRGMSMVCKMLHGGTDASTPQQTTNGVPVPPPSVPETYDPISTQAAHNKNGHAFIKVVGTGGGGGNAIARMISTGLQVRSLQETSRTLCHVCTVAGHHVAHLSATVLASNEALCIMFP